MDAPWTYLSHLYPIIVLLLKAHGMKINIFKRFYIYTIYISLLIWQLTNCQKISSPIFLKNLDFYDTSRNIPYFISTKSYCATNNLQVESKIEKKRSRQLFE